MLDLLPAAFAEGLGLGAGLIIAIGAQNAYVLHQGLKNEQVFVVTSICVAIDASLIGLGVGGFARLIAAHAGLTETIAWIGAAFLFAYGLRAFYRALKPGVLDPAKGSRSTEGRGVVLTTLAISLLNPHVYLDTVVLIGGLAAQHPPVPRAAFALGAICASFLWFYGLGYGATRLRPLFAKPAAWRVLDIVIGCVMWTIAANLLAQQI